MSEIFCFILYILQSVRKGKKSEDIIHFYHQNVPKTNGNSQWIGNYVCFQFVLKKHAQRVIHNKIAPNAEIFIVLVTFTTCVGNFCRLVSHLLKCFRYYDGLALRGHSVKSLFYRRKTDCNARVLKLNS